ncbi:MAG TPA: response regulator [Candidatus Wallbacteria bacterium]|nr:response regulator [Candidatus Wallbacteria bacterium]
MKDNNGGIFERIHESVSKLGEIKNRLESESIETKKEVIRRRILESIVFHETKIPLEAISDIAEMSPLAMGRSCVINSSTALSVLKFNAELVSYLQSYLSPEFDPGFVMETEFDFNELMFTALCSLYSKFKKKSVNISTRFYKNPILVKADKYKLYCILLNLLDNSLKFSGAEDEIVITTLVDEQKRALQVEFLDHGGGFDQGLIDNYFSGGKLSIELNESDSRSGLIIIHKFLQEINASLELNSREGEGAALMLNVNIADSFDLSSMAEAEHEISSFSEEMMKLLSADPFAEGAIRISEKKSGESVIINVVVLDEEKAACDKIKEILVEIQPVLNCTFNVSILSSGKNTVIDIINCNPDIIFIEPVLKTQDGFEILQQIKSTFEISQIPVIVLSKIKCQVKASKFGAAEYVSKPVTNSAMINICKNFVLKLNDETDLLKEFN